MKILDSLVLKCRVSVHISLFCPVGFVSFVFSIWNQMCNKGQQTYRRVILTHLPPRNFQPHNFDSFYIEKLILNWSFGLIQKILFVGSDGCTCVSLFLRFRNAQCILRFSKLNISAWHISCIIFHSSGYIYLLVRILHISYNCILVKMITCYCRELFRHCCLCQNIFTKWPCL